METTRCAFSVFSDLYAEICDAALSSREGQKAYAPAAAMLCAESGWTVDEYDFELARRLNPESYGCPRHLEAGESLHVVVDGALVGGFVFVRYSGTLTHLDYAASGAVVALDGVESIIDRNNLRLSNNLRDVA